MGGDIIASLAHQRVENSTKCLKRKRQKPHGLWRFILDGATLV